MHVRRRDMLGQLMPKTMRVIYWFHPACWFLDRRLMEAREWATDRQVVETVQVVDGPMGAEQYAESLLNIVSRVCTTSPGSGTDYASAIAMSAVSGMETRLKHILRGAPERSLKLLLAGPCSVAALVLMTALTTARIEQVAAQDESAPSSERNDQPPAETIATENDLFSRVRDCDVLTVTGDEFGAIFTASGQVVSPEGEPVEGAIVLLREDRGTRVWSRSTSIRQRNLPLNSSWSRYPSHPR